MPKLLKKSGIARHASGKGQRSGQGGTFGRVAKPPSSGAASTLPATDPSAADAATTEEHSAQTSASSSSHAPSDGAKRTKKWRDAKPKSKPRAAVAKAAVALPKDMGATAEGRHAAFARDGRSDASAARLSQYHTKEALVHIKKLVRKDPRKAAAVHGAYNRDPTVRLLNEAAGIHLSEDASLDTRVVDNLAPVLREAASGQSYVQQRIKKTLTASMTNTTSPKKVRKPKKDNGRSCSRRQTTTRPWKSSSSGAGGSRGAVLDVLWGVPHASVSALAPLCRWAGVG